MKAKKATIAVLIDALGWEFIEKSDFLKGIVTVRMPVRTVLGYSSSAIPCILTGKQIDEHGMWNLFYYSPRTSPFRWTSLLGILPSGFIENRYARYIVKMLSKKMSGYTGYFSCYGVPVEYLRYFDICEKKDIYQPGGIEGVRSIFDILRDSGTPHVVYSYHRYTDAAMIEAARRDVSEAKAEVYFLYLSELDAFLHRFRHDEDGIKGKIAWYGRELGVIYEEALKRYSEVDLHVFSDHGMARITETYDIIADISKLGLRPGKDFLAMYDSTMARFWFFRDGARKKVEGVLKGLKCGRILSPAEMKEERIKLDDDRYGELIFLMNPGTIITPSYMGRSLIPGMHGFHPSHHSSTAMYLSNRKSVADISAITDIKDVLLGGMGLV